MLSSYFFIPTNKGKFIQKVSFIDADCFVFDLEDAVAKNEANACLERLNTLQLRDNYYVRPRIVYNKENNHDLKLLTDLIDIGFRKFLIPKIRVLEELEYLNQIFYIIALYSLMFHRLKCEGRRSNTYLSCPNKMQLNL